MPIKLIDGARYDHEQRAFVNPDGSILRGASMLEELRSLDQQGLYNRPTIEERARLVDAAQTRVNILADAARIDVLARYVEAMETEFRRQLLASVTETDLATLRPHILDVMREVIKRIAATITNDEIRDSTWNRDSIHGLIGDAIRASFTEIVREIAHEMLDDPALMTDVANVAKKVKQANARAALKQITEKTMEGNSNG